MKDAIFLVVGGLAVFVGVAALVTLPTWLLWNWLCPTLFGLPPVTFLQAFGLLLLCSCLFKGSASSRS